MGTQYRVTFADTSLSESDLVEIERKISSTLRMFSNLLFSTYESGSQISRWSAASAEDTANGQPVLTPPFLTVVRHAFDLAEDSAGAFDPTIGPLVNRWQFGPDRKHLQPPSDAEIAELLELVGWQKITFDEPTTNGQGQDNRRGGTRLIKSADGIRLDLSAIAKGRGVDFLAEELQREGYTSFLIDIGGELRAVGKKPNGQPWKVAVRDPKEPFNSLRQSQPAALIDASIATSGSYFNFYEVDGVRYSHTIDPRTGRPVTHDLASVTVVACNCETADAYATTLMVLGPDEGYDWAQERNVAAMLIQEDGTSRLTDTYTSWLATGAISCPKR